MAASVVTSPVDRKQTVSPGGPAQSALEQTILPVGAGLRELAQLQQAVHTREGLVGKMPDVARVLSNLIPGLGTADASRPSPEGTSPNALQSLIAGGGPSVTKLMAAMLAVEGSNAGSASGSSPVGALLQAGQGVQKWVDRTATEGALEQNRAEAAKARRELELALQKGGNSADKASKVALLDRLERELEAHLKALS